MDRAQVRMVYRQGTGEDGEWTGHRWGWCMDRAHVGMVYGQGTCGDGVWTVHG